jgi:hypothetical protein
VTKKDYTAIAADIAIVRKNTERGLTSAPEAVREVADSLAGLFKRDNALFDRHRFLTACGFDPNA